MLQSPPPPRVTERPGHMVGAFVVSRAVFARTRAKCAPGAASSNGCDSIPAMNQSEAIRAFTVRLPEADAIRLERAARAQYMSCAGLIRRELTQYLDYIGEPTATHDAA